MKPRQEELEIALDRSLAEIARSEAAAAAPDSRLFLERLHERLRSNPFAAPWPAPQELGVRIRRAWYGIAATLLLTLLITFCNNGGRTSPSAGAPSVAVEDPDLEALLGILDLPADLDPGLLDGLDLDTLDLLEDWELLTDPELLDLLEKS